MVRGVCVLVRGSEGMKWKYDDDKCKFGLVETEKHVFLNALYMENKIKMESGCKRAERWYGVILNNKRVPCEK